MERDKLDILLENFLSELKNKPSDGWVRENADNLYREGIGKDGLLKVIREENGSEIYSHIESTLNKSDSDLMSEEISRTGVGGWLVLLCLALIIFSPARNIYTLYSTYEVVSPLFSGYPGIKGLSYVTFALFSIVIVFSVYAGIALWTIKPYAVKITKIYLITFLVINLTQPALLFLFELPQELVDASLEAPFSFYIQPIVFFIIWFSYLTFSERVKETYNIET